MNGDPVPDLLAISSDLPPDTAQSLKDLEVPQDGPGAASTLQQFAKLLLSVPIPVLHQMQAQSQGSMKLGPSSPKVRGLGIGSLLLPCHVGLLSVNISTGKHRRNTNSGGLVSKPASLGL